VNTYFNEFIDKKNKIKINMFTLEQKEQEVRYPDGRRKIIIP